MQKKGMELERLVKSGDVVLAGVSGGADSVCLLLMLLEYRKHCDFFLEAVHVEHGIRGDASRRDAAFVKRLCEKRGVCCRIYPVDVPAYAKGHGLGVEEAARKLRYECFREAAEDYDGRPVKIALAHHADDNAETMLFRLIRGPGRAACAGSRPCADGSSAPCSRRPAPRSRRIWRHRDSLTAGMRPMRIPTTAETGFAIR